MLSKARKPEQIRAAYSTLVQCAGTEVHKHDSFHSCIILASVWNYNFVKTKVLEYGSLKRDQHVMGTPQPTAKNLYVVNQSPYADVEKSGKVQHSS